MECENAFSDDVSIPALDCDYSLFDAAYDLDDVCAINLSLTRVPFDTFEDSTKISNDSETSGSASTSASTSTDLPCDLSSRRVVKSQRLRRKSMKTVAPHHTPVNLCEQKLLRDSGQSYVNSSGKTVPERRVRQLEACRMQCRERIPATEQERVFRHYWQLGSYAQRHAYAAALVDVRETKSLSKVKSATNPRARNHVNKYFLEIRGKREPVCQKCFRYTLCETEQYIKTLMRKKLQPPGATRCPDMRGRHVGYKKLPAEKTQEVIDFIRSFPTYQAQQSDTVARYMAADLCISSLHRLYCEARRTRLSLSKFAEIFHTLKLQFIKPKEHICGQCALLSQQLAAATVASDATRRDAVARAQRGHQHDVELVFAAQDADKTRAATAAATHKTFSFAFQQCLPTPLLRVRGALGKRQLWTYNCIVHDCSTGQPTCYMWHEALAQHGANEIASCLFSHLRSLPAHVKHVTFYSDSCAERHKNTLLATMFLIFMQLTSNIEVLEHKFLMPGHTYMECDADHALIERKRKKIHAEIQHPRDWFQLVRTVGAHKKFDVRELDQRDFYNFEQAARTRFTWRQADEQGHLYNWAAMQWLRFTKDHGTVFYKTTLNETEHFRTINVSRWNVETTQLKDLRLAYKTPPTISNKKKTDLLQMLPHIDVAYHDFYRNLESVEMPDMHPDLCGAVENVDDAEIVSVNNSSDEQ